MAMRQPLSGTVHIEKDLGVSIDGKDVIIVEDIVDSGLTLLHVYNIVSGRGAAALRVATLLDKAGNSKYERGTRTTSVSGFRTNSWSDTASTTLSVIATFPRYVS